LTPLDPQPGYHYVGLSIAHVIKGDFEKALDCARAQPAKCLNG